MKVFKLIGFDNYIIKDKILHRKEFETKAKRNIEERLIKRTFKDKKEGYFLVRKGKRKFHSLKSLKHRLKRIV